MSSKMRLNDICIDFAVDLGLRDISYDDNVMGTQPNIEFSYEDALGRIDPRRYTLPMHLFTDLLSSLARRRIFENKMSIKHTKESLNETWMCWQGEESKCLEDDGDSQ